MSTRRRYLLIIESPAMLAEPGLNLTEFATIPAGWTITEAMLRDYGAEWQCTLETNDDTAETPRSISPRCVILGKGDQTPSWRTA